MKHLLISALSLLSIGMSAVAMDPALPETPYYPTKKAIILGRYFQELRAQQASHPEPHKVQPPVFSYPVPVPAPVISTQAQIFIAQGASYTPLKVERINFHPQSGILSIRRSYQPAPAPKRGTKRSAKTYRSSDEDSSFSASDESSCEEPIVEVKKEVKKPRLKSETKRSIKPGTNFTCAACVLNGISDRASRVVFDSNAALIAHKEKYSHPLNPGTTCTLPGCGRTFLYGYQLTKHLRKEHIKWNQPAPDAQSDSDTSTD